MEAPALAEKVRGFILEELLQGEDAENLENSTELTTTGILDSVSTLKMATFLEEAFGIRGPQGISAFLAEKGSPGFRVGAEMEKMGLRTSPMCEIFLDDCEVPVKKRLGKERTGTSLFNHSMTWERSCILSSAVGAMERLLETCIAYAKKRKQFGQPIEKFQLVFSKIVEMKIRLESSRALLYKTAWLRSQGKSVFMEAALAKLHISEAYVQCAEDAIQIHGGYGYIKDYEVERELRDAIGSRLYSGTSEIQRTIIAPLLGL